MAVCGYTITITGCICILITEIYERALCMLKRLDDVIQRAFLCMYIHHANHTFEYIALFRPLATCQAMLCERLGEKPPEWAHRKESGD
jgi:hypothetical protein